MVSRLGSLVQSCCGEGGALQTNVTGLCVGRTCSVPATPGLPPFMGVCFPRLHCSGSRLLYLEGPCVACGSSSRVLHKSVDSVGPAFCVFPAREAQAARSLTGALSPGAMRLFPSAGSPSLNFCAPVRCIHLVSVLGSWPLAATLPADVDHPESQEVFG